MQVRVERLELVVCRIWSAGLLSSGTQVFRVFEQGFVSVQLLSGFIRAATGRWF